MVNHNTPCVVVQEIDNATVGRQEEIRKRREARKEKDRYYRLVRLLLNSGKCNPVREVP